MKVPLSWVREFISFDLPIEAVVNYLTMTGLEVDSCISEGDDHILEISLTPNLNYCSSIYGVARELAAVLNKQLNEQAVSLLENGSQTTDSLASITVACPEACPRYMARMITGIRIAPSPVWLQNRLTASGIRTINNVVDITNYILHEFGHPLHAFDYDKIAGGKIHVRQAEEGEVFLSLDEIQRTLPASAILVCDMGKPIAIGGVIGGANTEVTNATVNVLLESAYFHPTNIRKTSKAIGLQTESSKRFERGSDPNQLLASLDRAAQLICKLAGGEITRGAIDVSTTIFSPKAISCRISRTRQVLGDARAASEAESIFTRLNFKTVHTDKETLLVTVPTYRVDITSEIDLIEEVARLYGYNNIQKGKGKYTYTSLPHNTTFLFERETRHHLLEEGLQELLTCDLIGPALLGKVYGDLEEEDSFVRIINPTSTDQSILRTSLLPALLQVVKDNIDRQNHSLSGFEMGRIHYVEKGKYLETPMAAVLLTGKKASSHWSSSPSPVDFYDIKGLIENVLRKANVEDARFIRSGNKTFHPGRQCNINIHNHDIGIIGEVHPDLLARCDINQPVFFAEISLTALMATPKGSCMMTSLPSYPGSERDWTITLDERLPIQTLFDSIASVNSPLLAKVFLKYIYRDKKIGEGKKNVTFSFFYRDVKSTVSQEKVDLEHSKMIAEVLQKIGIKAEDSIDS
ncbi:phenylalanine--tRNA ligase subunit beta [Simkania negevensis]|uniref:Phenylalanine--tRNA ligase beta subunit n=1 Tax=Simkania negevensis TaxID=83561 RepID=A0ABS3APY3_9BACT|nr:phenylalanine--tRNA ligase subunit beta [Simkania negevensis]